MFGTVRSMAAGLGPDVGIAVVLLALLLVLCHMADARPGSGRHTQD